MSSAHGEVSLSMRLAQARLFLRKAYSKIDPELPALLEVLEEAGAGECWHKHGTFFEHLYNVYRNLKLWNVSDSVARCGLFHSAYSNSYVNLAIFEPNVDRQKVRDVIGKEAEELVHWFCIVPRQQLIFDILLSKYSDEELLQAVHSSSTTSPTFQSDQIRGKATSDMKTDVPPEGLIVKHIRTGENLHVPRRLIAIFLILTIADFSDQWYGWQDTMFGNSDGNMDFSEDDGTALWPGDGNPGLWMTAIARMGLVLNRIVRDEEEYELGEKSQGREEALKGRPFGNVELRVLPILNRCTSMVSPSDQVKSRSLYWDAVCTQDKAQIQGSAKSSLVKAIEHNPFIAEPHIVLAQILLEDGEWEEAEKEATRGLELLLEWGTHWDKRMTWESWIAWARVLLMNGKEKTWPKSGWGVISLGLVK